MLFPTMSLVRFYSDRKRPVGAASAAIKAAGHFLSLLAIPPPARGAPPPRAGLASKASANIGRKAIFMMCTPKASSCYGRVVVAGNIAGGMHDCLPPPWSGYALASHFSGSRRLRKPTLFTHGSQGKSHGSFRL
jgi:hypothetical protein